MNKLTCDQIVIDTNVFEHLFNPKQNTNRHISCLLSVLAGDGIRLLVDEGKRITGEYTNILQKRVKQIEDTPEVRYLLLYWIGPENHCGVEVDQNSPLMREIKSILPTGAATDAVFVYLALGCGKILITNDQSDIIDEGNNTGKRRKKLVNIKRSKGCLKGADIFTSREAYNKTQP